MESKSSFSRSPRLKSMPAAPCTEYRMLGALPPCTQSQLHDRRGPAKVDWRMLGALSQATKVESQEARGAVKGYQS